MLLHTPGGIDSGKILSFLYTSTHQKATVQLSLIIHEDYNVL